MPGGTMTSLIAVASWCALAFVGVIRSAGWATPRVVVLGCAFVAAPVAIAAAINAIAGVWRGPTILSFGRADAVRCSPGEASYIRAAAQLRGTMGGAGYLYPRRLALPALAWMAAAVAGLCGISSDVERAVEPWPVLVAIATALAALMVPARPYFYRETAGGGAIVSPPAVAYRLKSRAARGESANTPAPSPSAGAAASLSAPSHDA